LVTAPLFASMESLVRTVARAWQVAAATCQAVTASPAARAPSTAVFVAPGAAESRGIAVRSRRLALSDEAADVASRLAIGVGPLVCVKCRERATKPLRFGEHLFESLVNAEPKTIDQLR
jgi:hypothetical protein